MTSIFNRWTDLDPALALRRIEIAHGSSMFDSYAYLDPQRAIKQIESALSIDLDDVAGVLSFDSSIEDAIDAALGENTAPHTMTAAWLVGTDGTISEADTAAASFVNIIDLANLSVIDDEGDPIADWSFIVEPSGKLALGVGVVQATDQLLVADSPIVFVVCATDPGGLYVEQEFTITVTA